jgi:hypothetical protein
LDGVGKGGLLLGELLEIGVGGLGCFLAQDALLGGQALQFVSGVDSLFKLIEFRGSEVGFR